jgi:hypothetical protein
VKTNIDRLNEKFSRTHRVLIQLYPGGWHEMLDRLEQAVAHGLTASKAIRSVNLCKGMPEHNRLAVLAALAEDRREILRGQGSFHTPLTAVSLDQLASGTAAFFSYLPDNPAPRRSSKRQRLPLTDPRTPKGRR